MGAVCSTLASTKNAVLEVKRRRAGIASPSRGGGNIDFGPLHTRSDRLNISTSDSVDHSNSVGKGSTSERHRGTYHSCNNGRSHAGAKAFDGIRGLSVLFGTSRRAKTAPAETDLSLALENRRQGSAGGYASGAAVVASATVGGSTPEVEFGRACGGEHAYSGVPDVGVDGRKKPAGATKIGETLAALPLSKVKIVIGKYPQRKIPRPTNVHIAERQPVHRVFCSKGGVCSLCFPGATYYLVLRDLPLCRRKG